MPAMTTVNVQDSLVRPEAPFGLLGIAVDQIVRITAMLGYCPGTMLNVHCLTVLHCRGLCPTLTAFNVWQCQKREQH